MRTTIRHLSEGGALQIALLGINPRLWFPRHPVFQHPGRRLMHLQTIIPGLWRGPPRRFGTHTYLPPLTLLRGTRQTLNGRGSLTVTTPKGSSLR